jgi:carbonic anhydrase/acetyltransferase-like protein (isoleucine patch superfamily)
MEKNIVYAPENITKLEANQIFVFGSNKEGNHVGGAAKTAVEKFGAIMGQGEGLQGQSYAIPTMGSFAELEEAVDRFFGHAEENRDKIYLMTKIGCGIAGHEEDRITELFGINTPINIYLPKDWEQRKYVAYEYYTESFLEPLTRIIRISDGLVGGYIGDNAYLSQKDDCFVSDNAKVYDNATVRDRAEVYDHATVRDNATVCDNAEVYDDAEVSDNAAVCGYAEVYDNAEVSGGATVRGYAKVYDNAEVYDNATVRGYAEVSGDAIVAETSIIIGNVNRNITNNQNIALSLYAQTLHYPVNGEIILFKRVNKTDEKGVFTSCYDENFLYKIGEIAKAKNPDLSTEDCASGLHASHLHYWNAGDTIIAVKIKLEDIITVQSGKVRCKKLEVIEEVKL